MTGPRYLDAGECALVVEFGDRIDAGLAAQVLALDAALTAAPPPGLRETVPTYRSLMIHYDPLAIDRAALVGAVGAALSAPAPSSRPTKHWRIPACYDAAFGEDLELVASATGLSTAGVIAAHAGARYRLVMYGFAPGWAYLDGLPAALTLPRRASPRDRIPEGSLIVAGGQAIVAGCAMPSGWHILGRTPERMFAPARDRAFLAEAGDTLGFDPVDGATFDRLSDLAARGVQVATCEAAA